MGHNTVFFEEMQNDRDEMAGNVVKNNCPWMKGTLKGWFTQN